MPCSSKQSARRDLDFSLGSSSPTAASHSALNATGPYLPRTSAPHSAGWAITCQRRRLGISSMKTIQTVKRKMSRLRPGGKSSHLTCLILCGIAGSGRLDFPKFYSIVRDNQPMRGPSMFRFGAPGSWFVSILTRPVATPQARRRTWSSTSTFLTYTTTAK